MDKSLETRQRIEVRNQLNKDRVKKAAPVDKMPSQEEMLAEAMRTEIENMKSLGA